MAYSKTVWNNNTPPDISAENLNKMEQGIYDAQFPDNGSTGQILSKTNDGTGWIDAPTSAEWGNITGQLSEQTDLVSQLDTKITMPSGGTSGQVLTKTANGADWQDVDGLSQKVSSVNGETPDTNGNVQIDATKIDTSSGVAIKSVSGNPVTTADALQGNALGVTATLEPIQDLHGYDHPWAGGAGKNLLKNIIKTATNSGVTATTNEDTSISFNGTPTQASGRFNLRVTLPAGTYTASGCPSGGGNPRYVVALYNESKSDASLGEDTGNGRTFALTETSAVLYSMYFYQGYGTYNDLRFYPQIEAGSVKTSFEPYENICPITGRTQVEITNKDSEDVVLDSVTVNLGQTVYGGTLNVITGELVVDRGFLTASADGSWRFGGTAHKYVYKNNLTTGSSIEKLKCNIAPTVTGAVDFGVTRADSGRLLFLCNALNITSIEDWNNYITNNNVQFVYELSTPQTIQLTPAQISLLTGTNIISTNADDLSVRYYATGQTGNVEGNLSFLLDKTASNETAVNTVSESIAPTETGTATQNYATGSYLMLNNRLCKVTSAIATGEQIIVGSNVQYTTVAEELAAILAQINA